MYFYVKTCANAIKLRLKDCNIKYLDYFNIYAKSIQRYFLFSLYAFSLFYKFLTYSAVMTVPLECDTICGAYWH